MTIVRATIGFGTYEFPVPDPLLVGFTQALLKGKEINRSRYDGPHTVVKDQVKIGITIVDEPAKEEEETPSADNKDV